MVTRAAQVQDDHRRYAVIAEIVFRRGTTAQWLAVNPILSAGEPGYESTTGGLKVGDGESTWTELDYTILSTDELADLIAAAAGHEAAAELAENNAETAEANAEAAQVAAQAFAAQAQAAAAAAQSALDDHEANFPHGASGAVFSIEQYGGVAGGADDSAAFAAAKAALVAAGGGTIFFPWRNEGWRVGAIVPVSNMTLLGQNRVLLRRTGASGTFFINVPSSVKNFTIENLTIDSAGLSTSSTIRPAVGSTGTVIRNCTLTDSATSAAAYTIDMQNGSSGITIEDNTFRNSPIQILDGTATFTAADDLVTTNGAHNLAVGNVVQFTTVTGAAGITAGAYYFVKSIQSATQITLAAGAAASPTIDITTDGTGTGFSLANGIVNCIRFNGSVQDVKVRGNWATGIKERFFYGVGSTTAASFDVRIEDNDIRGYVPGGSSRQPITFQGVVDTVFHKRIYVNRNTIVGPGLGYNDAVLLGTADQISVHRCQEFEVIGNVVSDGGDVGLTVALQCSGGTVTGNTFTRNDTGGMCLGSGTTTYIRDITVTGNTCRNNGQSRDTVRPANARCGIIVTNGAERLTVVGNTLSDDQTVPTQQYGLWIQNADNITYGNNGANGNGLAPVGIGTGNTGLVDEASNAASHSTGNPYRRSLVHALTLRFSGYSTALANKGYDFMFPQAFTIYEDRIYVLYGASTGGVNSGSYVQMWNFLTGALISGFHLPGGVYGEGLVVTRTAGTLYLYAMYSSNQLGRWDITTTPAERATLPAPTTYALNVQSQFTYDGEKWTIQTRNPDNTGVRHQFTRYNSDMTFNSYMSLDPADAWPVTSDLIPLNTKAQGIATHRGGYAMIYGGTHTFGDAVAPDRRPGIRLFTDSGEKTASALMDPDTFITALRAKGLTVDLIEGEGLTSYNGSLYALWVTASHATVGPYGIVITRELSGDIDCTPAARRGTLARLADYNGKVLSNPSGIRNPITGDLFTSMVQIIEFMRDTGTQRLGFHTTGSTITDVAGATMATGTQVDILTGNFFSWTVSIRSLVQSAEYWVSGAEGSLTQSMVFDRRTGAADPEGNVAAPIGSIYTRTTGGANTTLYVKTAGTGNTGWTAK
jgi:hypothetical protein